MPSLSLSQLPTEIILVICEKLLGWDVVNFSKVNRRFHMISKMNKSLWIPKGASSCEKYAKVNRALQFTNDDDGREDYVPIGPSFLIHSNCFSIEATFSVSGTGQRGGILLGGNSGTPYTARWPHYHMQFVLIDPNLNLYASFTQDRNPIAKLEKTDTWYHLMIIFDAPSDKCSYFLDGKLVAQRSAWKHREISRISHVQLGTGCISADSGGKPTPDHCGWYPFNGMVFSFNIKVGNNACREERVQERFKTRGERRGKLPDMVDQVKCTNPIEVLAICPH